MKIFLTISTFVFILPLVTFAQSFGEGLGSGGLIQGIIGFINNVLFPLALAIAFIFLVWGIIKYFVIGGDSDDGKSKGKQLIIYAVVAFVVILSFYGLVNLLTNAFGLGGQPIELPDVPGFSETRSSNAGSGRGGG